MPEFLHVLVEGRVQGVSYRYWTKREAERLGLSGWVQNRSDGSVEAGLQGDPRALEVMVALMQDGPELASVATVQQLDSRLEDLRIERGKFEIRSTRQLP